MGFDTTQLTPFSNERMLASRVSNLSLTAHALAELTEEAGCPLSYKTTLKFMKDPSSVSKYTLKRIDQALNWEENRRERNHWARHGS